MFETRPGFLVGGQQAHYFGPQLWIAGADVIQVRLARGWLLQQGLVEHCAQAPMPVGRLTHRPGSSQGVPAGVNKGGR